MTGKEMEEAEAELSKQNESIALADGYIDKLKKELVEAEKEIYERARGEEKEWERAEKAEAEVERLQSFESTAEWLADVWDEFEEPIALEARIQDPLERIHAWASDWKAQAKKAEAELARARSLYGALREELNDSVTAHKKTREKLAQAREKIAELREVLQDEHETRHMQTGGHKFRDRCLTCQLLEEAQDDV